MGRLCSNLHLMSRMLLLIQVFYFPLDIEVRCAQTLRLWRNSSSEVNNELYKGYRKGNTERKINEITAGRYIIISLHFT